MGRAMTTGGAFTFKGERRAHPGAVTRCFRDIVRSWRTGHWRGGMALTRHYDRLAHRGLGFDRFGRGRFGHWRLLHGFCDRGDSFHWRCNDRRRFHRFRFYHHRLGVERHWRDSLRRFDSRCFGDRLLRRWLDGCWRDNFRSINDQRLGGRYRLDDYRLSGYWFHGSRLDGDRRSGNGFNDGNRGRYSLDSFRDAGVLNLNLFRLLILRTNHRVADPDFTGSHLRRCAGYGQRHRRLGRIAFVTIATTTLTADAQVTRGAT